MLNKISHREKDKCQLISFTCSKQRNKANELNDKVLALGYKAKNNQAGWVEALEGGKMQTGNDARRVVRSNRHLGIGEWQ